MDELAGTIERVTFHNPDNGFTVARIKVRGAKDPVCIVGSLPAPKPGETINCFGKWQQHPSHGPQFLLDRAEITAPATLKGIEKYLASSLVKGIGPVYAKKICARFGDETLDVIENQLERLLEIPGMGEKRLEQIEVSWQAQKAVRDVMIFLQSCGISPAYAQKIYKVLGREAIKIVQDNPYTLSRHIFGIGFKMTDKIAGEMGIEKGATIRIESGIEYVLDELSSDGHVCYPLDSLIEEAAKILEVDSETVKTCLDSLAKAERVVIAHDPPFVWRKHLFMTEQGIAKEITRLKSHPVTTRPFDIDKAIDWAEKKLKIELAPGQKGAIKSALQNKVQIMTGGPGTGKSTITNALLLVMSYLTRHISLAAPTGRAAKRMSEITKRTAQTIHALLGWDFNAGGFKKGRDNPIKCDLIIIDEASMIDTPLMYSLLRAIPDHARVVFVGDIDQLPSVGPGNVLRDLIDSKATPVSHLSEIFRQARGSRIIISAHRINEGEFPLMRNDPKGDFFFIEKQEPEEVQAEIIELVHKRLPSKYRLDPIREIQVLAPMKRGVIGTEELNRVLQNTLNPGTGGITRFGRCYRKGDKVMQVKNNYDKKVSNGDVGVVTDIEDEEDRLTVSFDGHVVSYEAFELDELQLAYAVSIHKYQGSECPAVVIPIHTSHFKLLHRNLLYTGVTRGKRLVVLVGTKKAVAMAVKNNEVKKRETGLKWLLTSQ